MLFHTDLSENISILSTAKQKFITFDLYLTD